MEKWGLSFPLQPLNLPLQLFNQLLHSGILFTQFVNCADVAGGIGTCIQIVDEVPKRFG